MGLLRKENKKICDRAEILYASVVTKEIGTEKIYAKHGNQHWTMRYIRYAAGPGENKSAGIKIMSPGDRVGMIFDVGVACDLDTFSYLVHLKTTYTL